MEQSYKEKYEQAIEKLRNFCRDYDTVSCLIDVKEELANLFPELAESEDKDEKIRKRLITDFGTIGKKEWGGLEVKDILAWLERQGEHANFLSKIQVGDKVTRNEAGVLVNLSQLKRVAKPREKQGEQEKDILENAVLDGNEDGLIAETIRYKNEKQSEQNPTDKVEPKFKVGDKIYLKPEYRMPDDDTPIANTVKEIRRVDDKHYRFDGAYIFIEDQDKYELVEQKPEENKGNLGGISPNSAWSEEDETVLNNLIYALENDRIGNNRDEYVDWLKSIKSRVQPKQEWSEEDKYMYDILCGTIENTDINENTKYKLISWLKSLRPQNRWKPSELQLGCLSDAIEHYNSLGYPAPKLKELLDDLKKLKGEV